MNFKENKNLKVILKIAPWIILAFVLTLDAWFLFVRGAAYVDSDMAANVLIADVNNQNGTILSDKFFYSTYIEILSDYNVYQIPLAIFHNDWVFARGIGLMIALCIIVLSYFLLCKKNDMSKHTSAIFAALAVSPLSYQYFHDVTFGGYYVSLLYNSMLILTLIYSILFSDSNPILRKLKYIVLGLYSFITGAAGMKYLMFPIVPIFLGAAVLIFIYVIRNKTIKPEKNSFELKCFIAAMTSGVFAMLGYLFNMTVLSKIYIYDTYSETSWIKLSISNLLEGVGEFLGLFGYQYDEHVYKLRQGNISNKVFSLQGIASGLGILIAAFLVYCVVRLIKRFADLSNKHKFIVVLFICAVISNVVILKMTDGFDNGPQYMIPLVPIAYLVMQIETETDKYIFKNTGKSLQYILTFFVLITSIAAIDQFQTYPYNGNPNLVNVANWLKDNGYKQGYATFWQSDSVTFLTNGEIEMWTIYGFDNLEPTHSLQKIDHINPPSGDRVFALIGPDDELDRDVFMQYMNTTPGMPEIVYQDDAGYIVVEYK